MLTTGSAILDVANTNNFAVPAFNISDWAMGEGIFRISEASRSPLLVAIHPMELAHVGDDFLASIIQRSRRSSVPVAIHFDHGTTVHHMLWGVRTGFTSMMLDGSMHSFEDNVALTRRAVEIAHPVGLSVEGELGTIGQADDAGEEGAANIVYTQPEDAVRFVEETGADSLAVAIGTSHGLYPASMKPELKLGLLEEIKSAVGVPLVLHGGSGNPDDEIAGAVKRGINKINISSDIKAAYHDRMREVLADRSRREPNVIQPDCVAAMEEVALHKIELFEADGKADLYRLSELPAM
ncbi:ketose-bisphosphate aldolase [Naumannella halotolerans]|uniref:Fructose-bisphosphate aldolase class II n=1 Tax=Naumannella halotolerans TaxID=993414 RepID=A0A4R7JAE0_9ACTN|nr:ketose-bisphosphate aldolase [Naumannella halotolerans]TDT33886.1 fructose-bisphosphate aldolase class II [Naumannella halotolerans]